MSVEEGGNEGCGGKGSGTTRSGVCHILLPPMPIPTPMPSPVSPHVYPFSLRSYAARVPATCFSPAHIMPSSYRLADPTECAAFFAQTQTQTQHDAASRWMLKIAAHSHNGEGVRLITQHMMHKIKEVFRGRACTCVACHVMSCHVLRYVL